MSKTIVLIGAIIVSFTSCLTPSAIREIDQFPDPSLTPRDVVEIQLTALSTEGIGVAGVEIAFRFASPFNKRMTGPVERFAAMLAVGPYQPMLSAVAIEYGPFVIANNTAVQRVVVEDEMGRRVVYDFVLRKQFVEPYEECWMTDSVNVVGILAPRAERAV